jgi:hypothetical protein
LIATLLFLIVALLYFQVKGSIQKIKKDVEMSGIDPDTSRMLSERSTI